MRKHVIASAIAIVSLGAVAMPVSADHGDGGDRGRREHDVNVKLRDNCDPASFDAAIGPGTCAPHGSMPTTTFGEFVAKLNPTDFGHPLWNIKVAKKEIDERDVLKVVVKGGEFHTFTEVPMFGPGCVPFINNALGLTGPAPTPDECNAFFATTGVAPGGPALKVMGLSPGVHMFECEIHPWMRTTITVEGEHENDD